MRYKILFFVFLFNKLVGVDSDLNNDYTPNDPVTTSPQTCHLLLSGVDQQEQATRVQFRHPSLTIPGSTHRGSA